MILASRDGNRLRDLCCM